MSETLLISMNSPSKEELSKLDKEKAISSKQLALNREIYCYILNTLQSTLWARLANLLIIASSRFLKDLINL